MAETNDQTLTGHVATFIADIDYADLPAEAIEAGKKSILDSLGVALSGAASDASRLLRDYLVRPGGDEAECTVFGGGRAPAPMAALANGTCMHADDFDDTLRSVPAEGYHGSLHPTAPILAALLAVAERDRRSGRDLIVAYHVGVEVAAKINDAIGSRHFMAGFHPTGTCGVLGVAAAVARLNGLNTAGIRHALGIAASQASGLRENFGSMVKPFHTGNAAFGGLMAADLAARGFTAAADILDAPRGFLMAYGEGFHEASIRERLGNPWSFLEPGMWLKPHPSGMRTHPAMTRVARLMQAEELGAEDVESITVKTSEGVYHTLLHHRPASGLQAKFSMPFCLAAIIVRGRAGLAEFTDEVVADQAIQAVMARIDYQAYSDEEARAQGYQTATTLLDVHLKNGSFWSLRADTGKGSSLDPMTYDDVIEKARGCAIFGGGTPDTADRLAELVSRMESLDALGTLTCLLSNDGGKRALTDISG